MEDFLNCGCGSDEDFDTEVERILREIEEDKKWGRKSPLIQPIQPIPELEPEPIVPEPVVDPAEPTVDPTEPPEAIPAPDIFTRKVKKDEEVPVPA